MDKVLYYNELYSEYKNLLTVNEQKIFELYYEDDLSLSEIANNLDISRSAVYDSIKKCESKLDKYEEILHNKKKTEILFDILKMDNIKEIKDNIQKIIDL